MMSFSKSALAALLCLPALSTAAQSRTVPAAYSNEAVVLEHFDRDETMHADGTGEVKTHAVVHVLNEAGARQFNVLSLGYASANEEAEITGVCVTKPDGRVVETPSTDAIEMPAEVTRTAPLYSDLKEKQLPLRSISGGDTLEYTFLVRRKQPQAPGQFWGAENFIKSGLVVLSETLTLHLPADKYVQVWSPKSKPTISESPTGKTYVWTSSQLKGSAKKDDKAADTTTDDDDDDTDEKLPDVAWTTFKSWAEVGNWYRSLALDRAKPTDELKAQTARIIAEAKTPEEKIRLIYAYVSTRTRYIGIDLGIGRYQPHNAMTVFENQYGDCKDKDTLLEAMLQSAGFTTAPALIGAGVDLSPDIPSPGFFNHVITTVAQPGGGTIWLDSTPELSPFAYLLNPLRDKQALVVPATGDAHLAKTPANPPFPLMSEFKAEGTLSDKGEMKAHIEAQLRDDSEVAMREAIRNISPAKWDEASQYIARAIGFGGTTSQAVFSRPEQTEKPFEMKWDYTRSPFGDWDDHLIVPLFNAIDLPYITDKEAPKAAIQLGAPRKEHSLTIIHVPQGYHVELPDPIHVKSAWVKFDKEYRFANGVITADRHIEVLQAKVPKASWKEYAAFAKSASFDAEPWIRLIPSTTKTNNEQKSSTTKEEKNAPLAPDVSIEVIRQRMQEAIEAKDIETAKKMARELLKRKPNASSLHTMLASFAMMQRDYKEAVAQFQASLDINPSLDAVLYLTQAQTMNNDTDSAEKTFLKYQEAFGANEKFALAFAQHEANANRYDISLPTLRNAIKANPANNDLKNLLTTALFETGKSEEAVAVAKALIAENPEDASALNSGAYTLAEANTDLPAAEKAAHHSVELMEANMASLRIDEANEGAFHRSNDMVAAWDTLGWIYFLEGRPKEALPYLRASWLNDLGGETGYHFARVLEDTDRKSALDIYRLAEVAASNKRLKKLISDRLTKLGNTGDLEVKNIQDLRTLHFPRPKKLSGWATYRVQIGPGGIANMQFIQGDQKVKNYEATIKAIQMPEGFIPAASKGFVLRDLVISCHTSANCDAVLAIDSGINMERVD